jgi:hypothetical protein
MNAALLVPERALPRAVFWIERGGSMYRSFSFGGENREWCFSFMRIDTYVAWRTSRSHRRG